MHVTWLVNCSAWTAVDAAESEPDGCYRLNVQGPENLAVLATELGAGVVHVSSDYVFSGVGEPGANGHPRPYQEDDEVDPQGVYGVTKALGEQRIRESCSRHLILRTAWLYGAAGPNFVSTMLEQMKSKDVLGVVADQHGSPTWTLDFSAILLKLLELAELGDHRFEYGTYHVSGEGSATWHEFAQAILTRGCALGLLDAGHQVTLVPLNTSQYPTRARRPAWSVLSKEKLHRVFGLTLPPWRDSLDLFLQEVRARGESRP